MLIISNFREISSLENQESCCKETLIPIPHLYKEKKKQTMDAKWNPFTCHSPFNRDVMCYNRYKPRVHRNIERSNKPLCIPAQFEDM